MTIRFLPSVVCAALLLSPAVFAEAKVSEEAAKELAALSVSAQQANDLPNAFRLLDQARQLATPEQWRAFTLRLIALRLQSGNFADAEKLQAEFEARYPGFDLPARRILEVKRLAAVGKFEEAARLGLELVSAGGLSRAQLTETQGDIANAWMGSRNYLEAADMFDKLEKMTARTREEQFSALCSRIYALQLAGRFDLSAKAQETAGRFNRPAEQLALRKLRVNQLLQEKKLSEFETEYAALRKDFPETGSDPLLFRITRTAADQFQAGKNPAAARYAADAFDFAATEDERKNVLRELMNIHIAAGKFDAAVETADRFLKFYPADPGRPALLLEIARLQAAAKKTAAAIKFFERIMADAELPAAIRMTAAHDGAVLAGQAGNHEAALRCVRYIVGNAANAEERQDGFFLMGEQNFRVGHFGRAAEAFAAAAEEPGLLKEKSIFWQLQSLLKAENFQAAAKVARQLEEAEDPALRSAAAYFRAVILERTGKETEAAAAYDAFAAANPDSEFALSARFAAAEIARRSRDYATAGKRFAEFAVRYPNHASAPEALYKALQMAFLTDNTAEATRILDTLAATYAASPFARAALFSYVDYLRESGRGGQALAELDRIEKLSGTPPSNELLAQLGYDRAVIYERLENPQQALTVLNDLLEKYIAAPVAADAARLAADIYSNRGDFTRASELYKRAASLRPGGRFATACAERQADCDFSAYSKGRDEALLTSAIALYRGVIDSRDPAFLYPALYKLGRCHESAGDAEKALGFYHELLYRAQAERRAEKAVDPRWCSKAAYSAVTLLQKRATPGAAREALKTIELFRSLRLGTGEDFDRISETIRNKYKI